MARRDGDNRLYLVAGLLCLVVFGFAAASLTSAVIHSPDPVADWSLEDSPLAPDDPPDDQGGDQNLQDTPESAAGVFDLQTCVRPLDSTAGTVGYFLALIGLLAGISRWRSVSVAMLSAYVLLPFMTVGYFLLTACASASEGSSEGGEVGSSILSDAADTTLLTPESAPLIVGVVLSISLLGAIAFIYLTRPDHAGKTLVDDADDEVDMDEFAEVAANAADRLEQANSDIDNEIYRAWKEMTQLLDEPKPKTSTPGDFASAAIASGVPEAHVRDLTELFEQVRYGGRAATGEREDRAVEIFRSIENESGSPGDGNTEQEGP